MSTIEEVLAGTAKFAVVCGDATEVIKSLPNKSISVCYCDPPYGLSSQNTADVLACLTAWLAGKVYTHHRPGFMGKDWDAFVPGPEAWREVYRVLKPGAYCVAYSSTRTVDLLGIAMRIAGGDVREGWAWLQGCLSDDTELLTGDGWVQYPKIMAGAPALCYDPTDGTYQWQPVQEIFVYPYSDTAYRVHSDRTDQLVTRNHRCLVERSGAFVFELAETAAQERQVCVPVLEDVQALLAALPLPHEGRPHEDADVRERVRGCNHPSQQHEEVEAREREASDDAAVCRVWPCDEPSNVPCEAGNTGVLLTGLLCPVACGRPCDQGPTSDHRKAGQDRVDGGRPSPLPTENVRPQQPRVEGRGDDLQDPWELRRSEVCAVSPGVPTHGPQGRLRHGAPSDRGNGAGAVSVTDRNGASRQSRPHGQPAGELGPVRVEPGAQAVRASRFTRANLVRVEPVPYTGIVWCVRVPTGAFVARRNGKVFVTGNSGFPKSLDVSKAIDKMSGAERNVIGVKPGHEDFVHRADPHSAGGRSDGWDRPWREDAEKVRASHMATAPATDAAKQWSGYGTTTKPAYEPLVVTRKPLDGTVASNVLTHGCGALNIDAARISHTTVAGGNLAQNSHLRETIRRGAKISPSGYAIGGETDAEASTNPSGRFPANLALVHDEGCVREGTRRVRATISVGSNRDGSANMGGYGGGFKKDTRTTSHGDEDGTETVDDWRCTETCAVRVLGEQSGELTSGKPSGVQHVQSATYGQSRPGREVTGYGDTGTGARFFYQGKASAKDRLTYLTCSPDCTANNTVTPAKQADPDDPCPVCHNTRTVYQHPTVKPYELALYHAKLLSLPPHTSPIAIVPFCGTGVEARALLDVGYRVIAVDIDPRHVAMTRYRLSGDQPVRDPVTVQETTPTPETAAPLTLDDLFGF